MAIIKSLLDTDLYKFTMAQAVFHHYKGTQVEYVFKCRTVGIDLLPISKDFLREMDNYMKLTFSKDEIDYLRSLGHFKEDFLEFLGTVGKGSFWNNCIVDLNETPEVRIKFIGPWEKMIFFEVPSLAIINELHFKTLCEGDEKNQINHELGIMKFRESIGKDNKINFFEFGTRRRFSREWQERIIEEILTYDKAYFHGTSNVYMAKKFGIQCVGTMAHEWLQAHQVLRKGELKDFQGDALDTWLLEYRGNLGIALTDVITTDAFLDHLDEFQAKNYDGFRQDSGDPFSWFKKVSKKIETLKMDPLKKSYIFSNSLTFKEARTITDQIKAYDDKAWKLKFGIGTHLTNNLYYKAINIVIKLNKVNGKCVAKVSDDITKSICEDKTFLEELFLTFNVQTS